MSRNPTLNIKKRKRSRKSEYARPFNYNIIAWFLLAILALFVLAVKCFW
jgi:hypothetical protein